MPSTPSQIMESVAALMNDTQRDAYTDSALIPYFNIALRDLQEDYELNNVPSTNATSIALVIAAGVNEIGFQGTNPLLPGNLVEIRQLWESPSGDNEWTPMTKKDFLPHRLENNSQINQFIVWSWQEQKIKVIAADAPIDLKLDYIRSLFTPIVNNTLNIPLEVINCESYLQYRTSALAAYFIGEDSERATALQEQATSAELKAVQIATKGRQSIATRRRPFRQAYKTRTIW